jgi:hypothetical protein
MEAFGVLLALALLAAIIILPIWLVSTVLSLRRRADTDRQESTRHLLLLRLLAIVEASQ